MGSPATDGMSTPMRPSPLIGKVFGVADIKRVARAALDLRKRSAALILPHAGKPIVMNEDEIGEAIIRHVINAHCGHLGGGARVDLPGQRPRRSGGAVIQKH